MPGQLEKSDGIATRFRYDSHKISIRYRHCLPTVLRLILSGAIPVFFPLLIHYVESRRDDQAARKVVTNLPVNPDQKLRVICG
jgi:hypothetical protein